MRSKGVTIKVRDDHHPHAIEITIPERPNMKGEKIGSKNISSSEWILLETLDCRTNRPLHTGPFLTVQRRRRRRKYVRTYLFKDPTLIDDLSVHQTNFVLDRIDNWEFNAFILDNVTGGRPLPTLCVHLFKSYGLLQHFNLDPVIVWKLFSIIEDGYHWRNPYHNGVHACDVTQAMHCFLQDQETLRCKLTPLEIFSAIVAAVVHDLDHPGVNQPFLIATSNHLAALYKNSSVLENHHWRSAMGCLNESGVSSLLGPERVICVEEQIRSLVLATDITRQNEFIHQLKNYLDTGTLIMDDPAVRHFVLQIALKCADISNPARPWDISRKWSMKVCEEFFRQGDYERQLNLPVTPLCDRYSSSVPKIQTGFYQFVVRPLFTEWHRMLNTPLSTYMMSNLDSNKMKWEQMLQDEAAQDAEMSDQEDSEVQMQQMGEDTDSSLNLAEQGGKEKERADDLSGGLGSRSVRFDPHTTITTASDSDGDSDGDDDIGGKSPGSFLGIPGPYARRHSIATGLMGSNIQVPAGALLSTMGMSSQSGSTLSITDMVTVARTVGRTVIRRESLPGTVGRTLPTKTILHLQRLSAKQTSESSSISKDSISSTAGATAGSDPGDFGDMTPASPNRIATEKSSCSSCSTTDEILDFTYSLPETGSRSSGSPRRLLHDATDLELLCPGTSILSMSPNVTHVHLQQNADLEDQRRHLIRQQTCPVVSISDGSGNFNRPRFLSAAAAVSPTAVASSSIISQHRSRNRSPEMGSGGSSSEALICEVISEEREREDRQSGGSSAEASPLEIFVRQFPPSDDNDGAPRRESLEKLDMECDIYSNKTGTDSNSSLKNLNYSVSNESEAAQEEIQKSSLGLELGENSNQPSASATYDSSTQTDAEENRQKRSSCPQIGYEPPESMSMHSSGNSSNSNRLGILMWRNNRLWKSLTEEESEDPTMDLNVEENILSSYYHGWDLLQLKQQGALGRLQFRRGSAPTTGPAMGSRMGQDRRSDPTQYHSNSCLLNNNINLGAVLGTSYGESSFCDFPCPVPYNKVSPVRRGSAPVPDLRQNLLRSFNNQNKPCLPLPRMGRRGSEGSSFSEPLPIDPASTGGPESGQQQKTSIGAWKAQIFIEKMGSSSTSPFGYYPGRRRGSLPIDFCIASSGSCSSESESSAECDTSDT